MVCPKCKNENNNNLKCEFCGYDFINNDAGKKNIIHYYQRFVLDFSCYR